MTDTEMTNVPTEGENTAALLDTETENSAESSAENNDTENTQSPAGEGQNPQDEPATDLPFHEHPRWKQRETEWDTRFNDQETRHQEDLRKIREEFGGARAANAEQTEIPAWFGGTQQQWDAYRTDRDKELKQAEERAFERITSAKTAEEKAVKDATDFMQTEITTIEADKDLNPTGAKIDPQKLLKFVLDNDLVDSKGRWNYRAGFRMMTATAKPAAPKTNNNERKPLAGATTSENRADTQPPKVKTSADFKKKRPW